MKSTSESDEWVMGQVAQGRREYLEVLVRRHATPLLTYLTRMTGDAHRSEELLQETFLAVWTRRGTYKLDMPLKSWLFAIATNQLRAAVRPAKGKPMASLEGRSQPPPAGRDPSPAEAALGSERAALVADAVARLPQQQRTVVTLRIWGQMPYSEIATVANCKEATVRSHMHRALDALREHLAPALAQD